MDEEVITDTPEIILVVDWDTKRITACDYKGKRVRPKEFDKCIYDCIDRMRHKAPLTFNQMLVEEV